jgi:putative ubiquitin-RnfH superfamily antitoxin RatB of RatAB toxin-antitoxin module
MMGAASFIEVTVAWTLPAAASTADAIESEALAPSNAGALAESTLSWAREMRLRLPAGSTLADALKAAGLDAHAAAARGDVGVWGKLAPLDRSLREGDRVELYEPLHVDPKEARRQRYQQHLQRYPKKAAAKS